MHRSDTGKTMQQACIKNEDPGCACNQCFDSFMSTSMLLVQEVGKYPCVEVFLMNSAEWHTMYMCRRLRIRMCIHGGLQSADSLNAAAIRLSLMMCSWQSDLPSKKFWAGSYKKKGWIEVFAKQKKKQVGFRFIV